jgi:hypothetical protein
MALFKHQSPVYYQKFDILSSKNDYLTLVIRVQTVHLKYEFDRT